MGKRKSNNGNSEGQFSTTQKNLDRKGRTNKKLRSNPQASKYLTSVGKDLKEKAEAFAKEHFKKGRRTLIKEKKAKEAAEKLAKEAAKKKLTKDVNPVK